MELLAQVKCPYCGVLNTIRVKHKDIAFRDEVIYCDMDNGGCDRQFVLTTVLKLLVDTREIVGERGEIEQEEKT
jgi:uncharacterized Zn-finger protein